LGLVSVVGTIGGYFFNVVLQGGTPGAYLSSFTAVAQLPDLWAGEVKALSSQTAKATEEIGAQITAMQSAVRVDPGNEQVAANLELTATLSTTWRCLFSEG